MQKDELESLFRELQEENSQLKIDLNQSERKIHELKNHIRKWYYEFKDKQISNEGDIVAKFIVLEFEKRFPFLVSESFDSRLVDKRLLLDD